MDANLLAEDFPPPEESEEPQVNDNFHFSDKEAFFFLFAVSFGPAFIAIDLSTSVSTIKPWIFGVIIVVIFIVFLMN